MPRSAASRLNAFATKGETKAPTFAMTGKISPWAEEELKKRGWKIVSLD